MGYASNSLNYKQLLAIEWDAHQTKQNVDNNYYLSVWSVFDLRKLD